MRELAASINFLADESDWLRGIQEEHVWLATITRETAARIRAHLDAEGVIRETVTAIEENLATGCVWVGLVAGW